MALRRTRIPWRRGGEDVRKGARSYYGTALTLGYLRRENAQMAEWIAKPAIEVSRDLPVKLAAGTGRVSLRVMQAGRRLLAVLNNWGR